MGKALTIFLFTATLTIVATPRAFAQYGCPPVYGGGEICPRPEALIDKMVKNPQSATFVDNLGVLDPKFSPGQEVNFRLMVKNTGTDKFAKAEVKDILPNFLDFISGPGSFGKDSRTLTFNIDNLAAGESRQFEVVAKFFPENQLPSSQGLFCVVNEARVKADDREDKDTTQLCVEKKVLGAAVQPVTGSQNWTFVFLGIFLTGILGKIILRKIDR